eukprot:CAMPEP_0181256204 /NCGR_PEP_ID=MMETSP1096-20121128/49579_1 /TAXON_ID=156174 ORGANISM="Chrysochromulina ericina, Strain CCMP281" /NCGR_SAMPLE_ID=MMETSP1096 /ASSEMBLY_ACC=CAM_ASM_000453 /LENGTH=94 /DNA_ID=CAMNT_0023354425 /DNA_START=328 /DNA_END=611 /DNA_ORIENTATION=+
MTVWQERQGAMCGNPGRKPPPKLLQRAGRNSDETLTFGAHASKGGCSEGLAFVGGPIAILENGDGEHAEIDAVEACADDAEVLKYELQNIEQVA